MFASKNGHTTVVETLLQHGASVDKQKEVSNGVTMSIPPHHMRPHERQSGAPSQNFWTSTRNFEETDGRAAVHVIGNYCIAHVYASLDVGVMIG